MKGKLILWMFVMFLLVTSVSGALSDDNLFYYSFDNKDLSGSNPLDLSVNGNDGVSSGTLTTGNQGKVLDSFYFTGGGSSPNSYVSTGVSGNIADYSISMWIKPELELNDDGLIGASASAVSERLAIYKEGDGDIVFAESRNSNSIFQTFHNVASQYGEWVHIGVTSEQNGNAKMFVNGVKVATYVTSNNDISLGANDLTLGAINDAFPDFGYLGYMDETAFWNKTLTEGEMYKLFEANRGFNFYDNPVPVNNLFISNLSALYYLNDNSYNLTDSIWDTMQENHGTGYGKTFYDGTVTGATLVQGLTGTITGATWDTDSVRGNVLSFDGSGDVVTVSDSNGLDISNELTISYWGMRDTYVSGAGIIDKYLTTGDQRSYVVQDFSDDLQMILSSDGTSGTAQAVSSTNSCGFTETGVWTKFDVVYNTTHINFYKDGTLCQTKTTTVSSIHKGTSDLRIGYYLAGADYFNGNLSNIHLYDIALNSTEITNLYNSELYPLSAENENNFIDGYYTDFHFPLNEGTGSSVYTTESKWDGKYLWNGAGDYIQVTNTLPLNQTLTISAWVKPYSITNNDRVIEKGANSDWKIIGDAGGNFVFIATTGVSNTFIPSANLPLNEWTYITFTHDGSNTIGYANGVIVDNNTATGDMGDTSDTITIGNYGGVKSYGFDGLMDEWKIYNKALSPTEIQAEMEANALASSDGIVAYYDFNGDANDRNHLSTGYDNEQDYTNKAINFDGSSNGQEIRISDTIWENKEDFSISIWYYYNDARSYLAGQYTSGIDYWDLRRAGQLVASNGTVFNVRSDYASPVIGQWNHLVVTCNNEIGKMYINGIDGTSLTYNTCSGNAMEVTGNSQTGTNEWGIGTRYPDNTPVSGNYFNGSISNVRIYDKALTQDEVTTLYEGLQFKNFTATEVITDNSISAFEITSIYGNASTTTGTINLNVPFGDISATFEKAGWYDNSENFTITAGTDVYTFEDNYDTIFNFTANNVYDNSAISNFDITISGLNFVTTDGTAEVNLISTETYSALLQASNYYNQTNSSLDASTGLFEFDTYQAILNLQALDIITGEKVQDPLFTAGLQSDNETLFVNAGSIPVTFSKVGWFGDTKSFTTIAQQESSQDFDVFNSNATFSFDQSIYDNGTYDLTISNVLYSFSETQSDITSAPSFDLTAGSYTYTLSDGATILSTEVIVVVAGNDSIDLTYLGTNYVYLEDTDTSLPISNANITITYPNSDSVLRTTDTNGRIDFPSYSSQSPQAGNYTIYLSSVSGYLTPITFTKETTLGTLPFNETYQLTQTELNVSIFYRVNGTTFIESADVVIQGVLNETTSTGNVNIANLTLASGQYIVQVLSEGYYTEQRVITFSDQESLELSFYLLLANTSNSQTLRLSAVDLGQRLVPNATITLLEYDDVSLSDIQVSQCITNEDGYCSFLIELNTKSYKWNGIANVEGTTITGSSTTGEIFQSDYASGEVVVFEQLSRALILKTASVFKQDTLTYTFYDIQEAFSTTTNISTISVEFYTTDGVDSTVCVEYFEISSGLKTSLTGDTFCATGSSATVLPTASFTLNGSKSYVAEVYATRNGAGQSTLQEFFYNADDSFEGILQDEGILELAVIFAWLVILALALLTKNVAVFGVGAIFLTWIQRFLTPSVFILEGAVLKTIICIFIIYASRKKEDLE